MSANYFNIEREGKLYEHVSIENKGDAGEDFTKVAFMSYEEIKTYDKIEEFVCCLMDAANELFEGEDEITIFTLVNGEDDVFLWSILFGPDGEADNLRYIFVDWHKDGKSYRYEKN